MVDDRHAAEAGFLAAVLLMRRAYYTNTKHNNEWEGLCYGFLRNSTGDIVNVVSFLRSRTIGSIYTVDARC